MKDPVFLRNLLEGWKQTQTSTPAGTIGLSEEIKLTDLLLYENASLLLVRPQAETKVFEAVGTIPQLWLVVFTSTSSDLYISNCCRV